MYIIEYFSLVFHTNVNLLLLLLYIRLNPRYIFIYFDKVSFITFFSKGFFYVFYHFANTVYVNTMVRILKAILIRKEMLLARDSESDIQCILFQIDRISHLLLPRTYNYHRSPCCCIVATYNVSCSARQRFRNTSSSF